MALLGQESQVMTSVGYMIIPLIFLILVLVYGSLKTYFRKRSENTVIEPYHHLTNLPLKKILAIAIIIIVATSGFILIGQIPIHRTSIQNSDVENDVSDSDIDIILVRSYLEESNIVLRLTVVGKIMNNTSSSVYEYRIIVVAKGVDDESAHIYTCSYSDGDLSLNYLQAYTANDTLTILFPLAAFLPGSFMIGLEGSASVSGNGVERDLTSEDRNGTIARLLF